LPLSTSEPSVKKVKISVPRWADYRFEMVC
jgi:hypothetical protein